MVSAVAKVLKNMMIQNFLIISLLGLNGCMSARDGRVLQKDIFEVNTRLVGLESSLRKTGEQTQTSSKSTNLRQANSVARLDKVQRELQMVRGDIDSLKIGVKTGKLPGTGDEEETVSLILSRIEGRLSQLEETQAELISMVEKRGSRKSRSKKISGKSTKKTLRGVAEFRKAFDRKRYSQVIANVGGAIKVNKGKIRQELSYMEAESLFKVGKLSEAAIKFNKFIERYKTGPMATKSRARMGDSFRHLGDHDTALIYYKEALEGRLSREEAASIKEKMAKLKTKKSA